MQLAHTALDQIALLRSRTKHDRARSEAGQAVQQHQAIFALPFTAARSIRENDDARAAGGRQVRRAGDAGRKLLDRRGLHDVERFAGRDAPRFVDEANVGDCIAPREHVCK